jgi:hypothetical protein
MNLPGGGRLACGFDHAVGFFVEVRRPGRKALSYDRLQSKYNHERPLMGAMNFLVAANVITQDDLDGAVAADDCFEEDDATPGELLAYRVMADLRRGASE